MPINWSVLGDAKIRDINGSSYIVEGHSKMTC